MCAFTGSRRQSIVVALGISILWLAAALGTPADAAPLLYDISIPGLKGIPSFEISHTFSSSGCYTVSVTDLVVDPLAADGGTNNSTEIAGLCTAFQPESSVTLDDFGLGAISQGWVIASYGDSSTIVFSNIDTSSDGTTTVPVTVSYTVYDYHSADISFSSTTTEEATLTISGGDQSAVPEPKQFAMFSMSLVALVTVKRVWPGSTFRRRTKPRRFLRNQGSVSAG